MNRRGFLMVGAGLLAAPAVVPLANLMPLAPPRFYAFPASFELPPSGVGDVIGVRVWRRVTEAVADAVREWASEEVARGSYMADGVRDYRLRRWGHVLAAPRVINAFDGRLYHGPLFLPSTDPAVPKRMLDMGDGRREVLDWGHKRFGPEPRVPHDVPVPRPI